tara:strand:+ start:1665 stop:1859 length:195 start_codon:yes stop_codon:yes gene_type:complete
MSREKKEAIFLTLSIIGMGIILGASIYYDRTKEETPPPGQHLDVDNLPQYYKLKGVSAELAHYT